jgi:DNA-binding Xre family transcriptional regulator
MDANRLVQSVGQPDKGLKRPQELSPRCFGIMGLYTVGIKTSRQRVSDMNARHLVAWNVRRIRVLRGISSERLAAESGVDRSYVSRLERGVANPSVDLLERLAKVLDVEMAELLAVPGPNAERPEPLPGGRRRSR